MVKKILPVKKAQFLSLVASFQLACSAVTSLIFLFKNVRIQFTPKIVLNSDNYIFFE
jgi:hypothetical protein